MTCHLLALGNARRGTARAQRAAVAGNRTGTVGHLQAGEVPALDYAGVALTLAGADHVDVVGTSKGKGYAGVIKRWNFSRLKMSHGTGPVARHGGSLGASSTPSRVAKGKKMAGHLGCERVTVQNLDVVKVDAENNIIAVKGAVPGPKGGIVVLSDSVKA